MIQLLIALVCGFVLGLVLERVADAYEAEGASRSSDDRIRKHWSITAVGFGLLVAYYYRDAGFGVLFLKNCVFASVMLAVMRINHRTLLVPNVITFHGIATGLIFSFVTPPGVTSAVLGVVGGGGSLFLIAEWYRRFEGKEGLGMGIVKLQAVIGAYLGWRLMLVALLVAALAGSVFALISTARRGATQQNIPFGSYLAVSAILATVAGEAIVRWYVSHL
jgi:leader peptidase (prepilin peptidase)/N-methyltransferase